MNKEPKVQVVKVQELEALLEDFSDAVSAVSGLGDYPATDDEKRKLRNSHDAIIAYIRSQHK